MNFTFLTICYNQSEYIERHLDSIKRVVEHYGHGIDVDFILADDCSQDNTVAIAKEWLERENIFNHVTIIEQTKNKGTVRNFIDGINHVQTRNFKSLAADDYYMDEDIFSLYKNIKGRMILTPVYLEGNVTPKIEKSYEEIYSLLKRNSSSKKMRKILIRYGSIIPAPGVIYDIDFVKNKDFQSYLLQFNLIEDYPMWYYFLSNFQCDVEVLCHKYIHYSVSSIKKHDKKRDVELESERLKKLFRIKLYILPRYINPYSYLFMFERKIFYTLDRIKAKFSS